MSGGYIDPQEGEGDHQLVIFTFIGQLDAQARQDWNNTMASLKSKFGNHLVGVTVKGNTTSEEHLQQQKPTPSST